MEEYIEHSRHAVADEYDREPLLTTASSRMRRTTLRRVVYHTTAPCFRGEPCTDCRDGSDHEYGDAVSPHAIRRGSITHFLTNDVPIEIVGDRMNVSRDVLSEHYDQRSESVKVEQRRQYLTNI